MGVSDIEEEETGSRATVGHSLARVQFRLAQLAYNDIRIGLKIPQRVPYAKYTDTF